ncbi:transcriptional regulator family: Fungal Specific TF [Paecilomyces variotii]|nr:transcriptional regulator family: Fungal Specific TF [Paecilomyces variotii]KAJ9308502.1 transcriptional regulator family: Fungal Specific TF [Paecilomyces variotii]
MPYEFINNNGTINPSARKQIRRHVATGKNAGKKLARPSRKKAFELSRKSAAAVTKTPEVVKKTHNSKPTEEVIYAVEQQIGDGLSILPVPDELVPGSRPLERMAISFIGGPRHAPEMSNALDTTSMSSSIWVQFMFSDEAYFHCMVALSVTVLDPIAIKPAGLLVAARHLSQTFRLINERLSGDNAASDTTIAVVVMLAEYERQLGHYNNCLVHIEGLQRMVELRGGISKLTSINPHLTKKIFRIDLEYALHTGSPTRFSPQDIAFGSTGILRFPRKHQRRSEQKGSIVYRSAKFKQLSADLEDVFMDIIYFAHLLNETSSRRLPKMDHCVFHENILFLGYRLIAISTLRGPNHPNNLEDMIHLGLTTFVSAFFWSLDRSIPTIPLLTESIRSIVQRYAGDSQEERAVLLWLLFTLAASISKQPDDEVWLVPKAAETMDAMDLHTWEDVHRTLSMFPWVNATHDTAGQALWQKSRVRLSLLRERLEIN